MAGTSARKWWGDTSTELVPATSVSSECASRSVPSVRAGPETREQQPQTSALDGDWPNRMRPGSRRVSCSGLEAPITL